MTALLVKKLAREHNRSVGEVEKFYDKAKAIITKKMLTTSERAKATTASATIDEVYAERAKLIKVLTCLFPSYLYEDPEDEEFRIVYVETPGGQLSWHIKREDCMIFSNLQEISECPWDGHDTNEKYERLAKLCSMIEERSSAKTKLLSRKK